MALMEKALLVIEMVIIGIGLGATVSMVTWQLWQDRKR